MRPLVPTVQPQLFEETQMLLQPERTARDIIDGSPDTAMRAVEALRAAGFDTKGKIMALLITRRKTTTQDRVSAGVKLDRAWKASEARRHKQLA